MVTSKRATAADLAALPDDGYRYELVRGEIRSMSPAGGEHGKYAGRFALPVLIWAAETGLGEVFINDTGFHLEHAPDTVRAPDVAFVFHKDLPPAPDQEGFLRCTPTLVVEVVSPSDSLSDVMDKVDDYLKAGVRLIWVAFPDSKTVLVDGAGRTRLILQEHDELDGGDVLPGLPKIPIAQIFR